MNLLFFNIENFFAPSPAGRTVLPQHKSWSMERYRRKLLQTEEIFGKIIKKEPPAFIGLAEIQGQAVIDDLLQLLALGGHYEAITAPQGDSRGFQPVLFYHREQAVVQDFAFHGSNIAEAGRYRFREFVTARFLFGSQLIQIILVHFPSKRNRDRHKNLREKGWEMLQEILLQTHSPVEKTFILGDFNEDFLSGNTRETFASRFPLAPDFHFGQNPTAFHHGRGVVCDHIFCFNHQTRLMENLENHRLLFPELLMTNRTTLAQPRPMYIGTRYFGGLSDHFPITATLEI